MAIGALKRVQQSESQLEVSEPLYLCLMMQVQAAKTDEDGTRALNIRYADYGV